MSLKYTEDLRALRRKGREQILLILSEKPCTSKEILEIIKKKNRNLCDDSIKCVCGGREKSIPEWQHQLRWAIQDLKYHGKLDFDAKTRVYRLTRKENSPSD